MLVGEGGTSAPLSREVVELIIADGISKLPIDGKSVLVVVPDHTRTAPTQTVFPLIAKALKGRASKIEVMVALGTHPPEKEEEVRQRLAIEDDRSITVLQHEWDSDDALSEYGTITKEQIREISGGLFEQDVCVRANRRLGEVDHVMILGPVFPHEVVGFSGGGKYLFPGCSGPEVLNFFHWLGAVITNVEIIGRKKTPVRKVVDAASALVPTPKSSVKMVVEHKRGLMGLYVGDLQEAWSAAADLSAKTHVLYLDKPVKRVLSVAPKMYDDLWTAAKCMYKLEPVLADGGELIIYAPHVTEVSYTHGKLLDEVGYHCRDYFLKQWETFKDYPWAILAHSTHVKGAGDFADGVETPRVNVILATGIPEERCKKINLGYMDPATVKVEEFENRTDQGVLYVPKAGEMLYRLK
jgi:nickel-dependent lactate racemase